MKDLFAATAVLRHGEPQYFIATPGLQTSREYQPADFLMDAAGMKK
jgi:hypothetical protein